MKKLIYLLVFIPFVASAQLNEDATHFKHNQKEIFEIMKSMAFEKWGKDYDMVVYRINEQSKSLTEFMHLYDFYIKERNEDAMKIMEDAAVKWCDGPFKGIYSRTDWCMVMYEVEKQLDSFASLE